jgi:hypothetical protein
LRRGRETTFAVEKQYLLKYSERLSVAYPVCKAHAQYYIVICGMSGSTIVSAHYITDGMIFEKKVIEHKI